MVIAIEAQRLFRSKKYGMDIVILETIRELQKIDHINEYYILVKPGEDKCIQETKNFHIKEVQCFSYPLWEQVALPLAIKKIKPDLLHCTSNTAPVFCRMPLLLTLHDIIFLEKKWGKNQSLYQTFGWYYRRWIVPIIVKKCKAIITVSNNERQNILNTLTIPQARIHVIHNGVSSQYKSIESTYEITKNYCPEKEYLLCLGNTDPRKNTIRVLKAYRIYLERSSYKRPLILTGLATSFVNDLLNQHKLHSIQEKLITPGYIKGDDLPYLYNGAFTFITPSLREGFGIPILEAMACATPVITSKVSSMPEIAGEKGILVNPLNENEIVEQLLKLETDTSFYHEQVAYGLERVKLFSWHNTARSLLTIYQSLENK